MFCQNCSHELPDSVKFCPECGHGAMGGTVQQRIELMNCPDCHGSGNIRGKRCPSCVDGRLSCNACGGGGSEMNPDPDGYALILCSYCGGSGLGSQCLTCSGTGQVLESCTTCDGVGQLPRNQVEEMLARRRKWEDERLARERERKAKEEAELKRREEERKKAEAEEAARKELERKRVEEERKRQAAIEAKRREEERKRAEEERKRQAVIEAKRREEERKRRETLAAEQRKRETIQASRRRDKKCIMCGEKLGLFDRLCGCETHSACETFKY